MILGMSRFDLDSFSSFTPLLYSDFADFIIRLIQKSNNAKELFGSKSAPSFGCYNIGFTQSVKLQDFITVISQTSKKSELLKNEDSKQIVSYIFECTDLQKSLKIKNQKELA